MIAGKELIKPGRSHQRTLVAANCPTPILRGYSIFLTRERLPEHLRIAGDALYSFHCGGVVGIAETRRTDQRLRRLVLDVLSVAAPVRIKLQGSIEHGRRIARVD